MWIHLKKTVENESVDSQSQTAAFKLVNWVLHEPSLAEVATPIKILRRNHPTLVRSTHRKRTKLNSNQHRLIINKTIPLVLQWPQSIQVHPLSFWPWNAQIDEIYSSFRQSQPWRASQREIGKPYKLEFPIYV